MNAHTPTPWSNADNDDCTHPAIHDQQFGECRVMGWDDYVHAKNCVNVHADLLAACEKLLEEPETSSQAAWDKKVGAAVRMARAAVAKAQGATP